jgi:type II secretory pathway component GspD/PulD (secretin)
MRKASVLIFAALFFSSSVFAQQIGTDARSLLSSEAKVIYGDEPNTVTVIDYPENLSRLGEYFSAVDVVPQQVQIEARVVEVKLKKEHSLGINWQLMAEKGKVSTGMFDLYSAAGEGVRQQLAYQSVYQTPGAGSGSTISPFTVTMFDDNLTSVLQMLTNQLDSNVLSAPRVTTVNNREAVIKIVQRYPWAEPSVTTSDSGEVAVSWTINFEDVGILLKVTPTISEDNQISMVLAPEVSEKVDDFTLVSDNFNYTVPIIDQRSAYTKVVVGNGQTLIIGGLMKDSSEVSDYKVPLLGDIPWLGTLFKSHHTYKEKTELLILVSPTIITQNEFVRTARLERYHMGKDYLADREALEKKVLAAEKREIEHKGELSTKLDYLIKRQKELNEESKRLQDTVQKEEESLKVLQKNKEAVIKQRKAKKQAVK